MTVSTLEKRLGPVRARMGLNRFLSGALSGLACGWGAAALLVGADRLFSLPFPLGWAPWAATAAPLAAAALGAWLRRDGLREAALLADRRLGLAERLSSALLVRGASPMEEALRADAGRHLSRLVPAAACPVAPSRRRAWLAASALAALGLALASPQGDLLGRRHRQDARDKALLEVRTAGTLLEKKARKLVEEARAKGVEPGEVGKGLEELAAELKDGIQDPKAALAEINDLQTRLKADAEQFQEKDKAARAQDLRRALQAMAREEGKAPAGAQADSLKDLLEEMKTLAAKLESGKASPEEVKDMQQALSDLADRLGKAEAARELANELSRTAQALEQQGALPQMGDNLENLADRLGQMDRALDRQQMMELAKAELEAMKRQLTGQDPWEGKVSAEDMEAFQQKVQEMAQNPQPGGT